MKAKRNKKKNIRGTVKRPRLSVFRSHRAIYAQIIDDQEGKTLLSVTEKDLPLKPVSGSKSKGQKTGLEKAGLAGEVLAKKALKKKIKTVVFDRGRYPYHGRIKALAEGARKGGLEF